MIIWVFVLAGFCLILERTAPGWKLPPVRTWPFRVIVVKAFQLVVVLLAGISWERWLSARSVFHLQPRLPATAAGCIAYFIGWRRLRHRIGSLWLTARSASK